MPHRSTSTNLLEFLEFITFNYDKGENLDLIYLDFSKAFDIVPWGKLKAKFMVFQAGF